MKQLLILALGAALAAGACGTTTASDAADTPLNATNSAAAVVTTPPAVAKAAAQARPVYWT